MVEREFKQLSEVGFREIAGQFLYIECKDILEKMTATEKIQPSQTGLIVYAYITMLKDMALSVLLLDGN